MNDEGEFDDRLKCPHCRRKFNPDPFSRHVEICRNNPKNMKIKM